MSRVSPSFVLKVSIFLTGFAGIVAEYLLSTLASYLLGDTIFQWTVVISVMLLAMGLGAGLSRHVPSKSLLEVFLVIELVLSLLVSFSAILAYSQSPYSTRLPIVIYTLSGIIGLLIGMEIPLAVRINDAFEELKENISNILEKDYLGALPGGILYAYFFLPRLGLVYTPLIVGAINILVAFFLIWCFRKRIKFFIKILFFFVLILFIILSLLIKPAFLYVEQKLYRDPIVYRKYTKYQQIVLTKWRDNYLLYLNGHLQFSTVDERRYHEALVHIPISFILAEGFLPQKVLILGGGDGCVLREVLKYSSVKQVDLVDIDKDMVEFASYHPIMCRINKNSFADLRVKVHFQDAFNFLQIIKETYDLIIIDLIDPRNTSAARIYSLEFYKNAWKKLNSKGVIVTQATSPFFAQDAFCCILKTMKFAGFTVYPYRVNIPSFGEWGFVIGLKMNLSSNLSSIFLYFREDLTEYFTKELALSSFYFGKNFKCSESIEINTLLKPVVLQYYKSTMWEIY